MPRRDVIQFSSSTWIHLCLLGHLVLVAPLAVCADDSNKASPGRVLVIEHEKDSADAARLLVSLRRNGFDVAVEHDTKFLRGIDDVQRFDCVILANVPRSSDKIYFSDEQIRILVSNTKHFGCGLILTGGDQSFGPGGWAGTAIETASPVEFHVKNPKIRYGGALAFLTDGSGYMESEKKRIRAAVAEAVGILGPMDRLGVLSWQSRKQKCDWLYGKPRGVLHISSQREAILDKIDELQFGDLPQFEPPLKKALAAMNRLDHYVKRVIIISDGGAAGPLKRTLAMYKIGQIRISTIAVGNGVGKEALRSIALTTGGVFYDIKDLKSLNRICQVEARRVVRTLAYESDGGAKVNIQFPGEIVKEIQQIPPIRGYVMTTIKPDPRIAATITASKPNDARYATILASWPYGKGRVVALTTDVANRWTDSWNKWEDFDKLIGQMVKSCISK